MSHNLLLPTPGICGNCGVHDGVCPRCGTWWSGSIGVRVEWDEDEVERFVRDAADAARNAGLPPGSIQVLKVKL